MTAVVAAWACGGCTSTAALKLAVWRVVSWPRVAAIAVLGLLGLVAGRLPALALELCAAAVVVSVAAVDYRAHPDARSREAPAA